MFSRISFLEATSPQEQFLLRAINSKTLFSLCMEITFQHYFLFFLFSWAKRKEYTSNITDFLSSVLHLAFFVQVLWQNQSNPTWMVKHKPSSPPLKIEFLTLLLLFVYLHLLLFKCFWSSLIQEKVSKDY